MYSVERQPDISKSCPTVHNKAYSKSTTSMPTKLFRGNIINYTKFKRRKLDSKPNDNVNN